MVINKYILKVVNLYINLNWHFKSLILVLVNYKVIIVKFHDHYINYYNRFISINF